MDNNENKSNSNVIPREKIIVRTSIIGIIANVLLAGFKAFVGLLSNSIAIILDAVNNLSDALSSVITIVGTKLAGKKPDRKHPLGYGRIEYLSALLVAAIVLYAGITSVVESVKKIINPEVPSYSNLTFIIISVAIVVKLLLGLYVKSKGKQVNSGALLASGSDALFDAVLSLSVLISAIIFKLSGISLEAYVGVIISIVIVKSGIEMTIETLNEILGQRASKELTKQIKSILANEPEVRGAYDLIINNYGPDMNIASVHLEVPDTMTVAQFDELTRKAEADVYKKTGVILAGVGVYSYNTSNDNAAKIRNKIQKIVVSHDWALQMHGFYLNESEKNMRFDTVIDFEIDAKEAVKILKKEIADAYPDYEVTIQCDLHISD